MAVAVAVPQHLQALAAGNRIRLERAALKQRLAKQPRAAALELCAELVAEAPAALRTMSVESLLESCNRVGRARARQLLNRGGIVGTRSIGLLTQSERDRLRAALLSAACRIASESADPATR